MKPISALSLCLPLLFALEGCAQNTAPQTAAQIKSPAEQYAGVNSTCSAQAESRLSLFDRPDTYPISDQERSNARTALFNECMKANQPQVAGVPRSDTQQASAQDAAALAALSPAAGGNPPPQNSAVTPYPGSTVIMVQGSDVSQLGSLSPSAGGNPQGGATGPYPGSTVVVVQAPAAAVSVPPPARPAATLPEALAKPIAFSPPPKPQLATALVPPPAPPAPKPLSADSGQDTQQLEQILTK